MTSTAEVLIPEPVESPTIDDLQSEVQKLKARLARYEKKARKPDFKGTLFHHFNRIGTVAVREMTTPTGRLTDQVQVGVSLLALPQYRDCRGTIIRTADLRDALHDGWLDSVRPGDQYSHALGRIISHGRAVRCRNYSGIWPAEYAKAKIIEIRELEKSIPDIAVFTKRMSLGRCAIDEFDEEFIDDVMQRAAVQNLIKTAFTTED